MPRDPLAWFGLDDMRVDERCRGIATVERRDGEKSAKSLSVSRMIECDQKHPPTNPEGHWKDGSVTRVDGINRARVAYAATTLQQWAVDRSHPTWILSVHQYTPIDPMCVDEKTRGDDDKTLTLLEDYQPFHSGPSPWTAFS